MPIPHTFNPLGKYRDSELYWIEVQPGIVTDSMTFNLTGNGTFHVADWGDGESSEPVSGESVELSHTYTESGTYVIRIKADCSDVMFQGNSMVTTADPDLRKFGKMSSCYGLFYNCGNISGLPGEFFIPETVTDCRYMFGGCASLKTLPETFHIPETIQYIDSIFNGCKALETLPEDFRFYDGITSCNGIFYQCTALKRIPEGVFIPEGVQNCAYMFGSCSMESLPVNFHIPDTVTSTQNMFHSCSSLKDLPDGFHIPDSATNCSGMFYKCSGLTTDISNIFQDFASGTKNVQRMMEGCSNVTGTIPTEKLWNNGAITWTDHAACFRNCLNLINYSEIPSDWR